ncbi:beta-fructofuranosidase [Diaporthe helianthi]|uniref:Beta-fructofuranosidase n=1 Tax=Diaporthe helianthi TaxID=158607 RepID=A0A2P5HJJ9_DIAHE|nr:beta-fructofuranosidase [Diaporthe helianthi]
MKSTVRIASTVLAATCAHAQGVPTYVNPAVPTGTPIAGNYTGPLRPQVHFSPPKNFMNDPNGMFVDANGTYHLYYQYNPTDVVAGNQHWGHATSQDLYRWENQQIALFPPEEQVFVFSGSAVVDVNNTSGFFPDQDNGVVAILTLSESNGPQTQAIAYSHDGGYTFEYYDGNPVINSTSNQFRDPKVIWYEDHWVAVIAYSQEFVVGIFTSPDLKTWEHASNFSYHGLLGTQYECPNMVKIPVRDSIGGEVVDEAYVMTISLQPGAPLGGSVTEYFPGTFNGTHFETLDDATRLTDFAKDNYAAQFFYGLPDGSNAINMGWASNWQYTNQVPTGNLEGWRSAMTLPRANYLTKAPRIGWVVVNELVDPSPVLDTALNTTTLAGDGSIEVDFASVASNSLYIEANVTGLNSSTISGSSTLNMTFSSPSSEETLHSGYYFGGDQSFFVNRGDIAGFDNIFFTDKFSVSDVWNTTTGTWRVQAVIDRSILEVFLDGGVHAATVLFYPKEPLTHLTVGTADLPAGVEVSVAIWALKSPWAEYEDDQGIVAGNVTGTGDSTRRDVVYEATWQT